jgi:hypothetical protein
MAKLSGRKLVVQTETGSAGLPHRFGEVFQEIFAMTDCVEFWDSSFQKLLKSGSIHPESLAYISSDPSASAETKSSRSMSGYRLRWRDLFRNESILIHEADGGGLASAALLPSITFSLAIEEALQQIHASIPETSVAIHFRSSDYRTSEESLYDAIGRIGGRPILLATDSPIILKKARRLFPWVSFYSVPELLSHNWLSLKPVERANVELFALASCKDFIPLKLSSGPSDVPLFSGYTRLAKHIWAVSHISKYGLVSWVRSMAPLEGSGGSKSKTINFAYLIAIGIPRILLQSYPLRGALKQGQRLLVSG